jgi:O-antigen ligase
MIVFSVAVVSADGLVQWARGVDFLRHQAIQPSGALEGVGADFRRIRASFSNCQSFAIYLVTVLPLLATLLRHGKMETRRTVILGLVSLVALSSFILTYSRGGAVAFLVSILFLVILKKDRLLLLALGGLIVIVPLIVARTPLEWALSRPNPLAFLYDSSRLLHWQTALNMIKAHPFLGVGINNFPVNYALYKTAGDTFGVWYAHNAYLQLTAETGIIGFCLFLALIGQVFARGWQALAMLRENQKSAAIALGFLASWVGYLTIGFWESHLQYSDMAVIFWLVAAMVTRLKTLAPQTNP